MFYRGKKINTVKLILFIISYYLYPFNVISQQGKPYLRNFPPAEYSSKIYDSSPQNFCIIQDRRGLIYVANGSGILEFDGVTWRMIQLPGKDGANRLEMDNEGTIFVGANRELGYLAPDLKGKMSYYSLLDKLKPGDKDFLTIYEVVPTHEGIYFQSHKKLFRINENKVMVWLPKSKFSYPFFVNNRFYIVDKDFGLFEMNNDSLVLLPKSSILLGSTTFALIPFRDSLLLCNREKGFYLMSGNDFFQIKTGMDSYLKESWGLQGKKLFNGEIGISTIQKGVGVIDSLKQLSYIIGKNTGLNTETVINLNIDSQQGLWLGTDQGLSRVEYPSPITYFDENNGFLGFAASITRHKGILYIGTTNNVYYLDTISKLPYSESFKPIKGVNQQTFAVHPFGEYLLVGTVSGLLKINNFKSELITKEVIFNIFRSKKDSNLIFLGLLEGLMALRFDKNNFIPEGKIKGISQEVRRIVEDKRGFLWIAGIPSRVYRLNFTNGFTLNPDIEIYDQTDGLPEGNLYPNLVKGEVFIGTPKGLFYFNPFLEKFSIMKGKKGNFYYNRNFEQLVEDENGRIWAISGTTIFSISMGKNGNYQWEAGITKRIPNSSIWTLFPERDGIIWAGTTESVVRIDTKIDKKFNSPFNTLIRRVSIPDERIIFEGAYWEKIKNKSGRKKNINYHERIASIKQPESLIPILKYQDNKLNFEFSACSYDLISENLFSYYLQGFDERWSEWSKKTEKQYTNLEPGEYTFRVKSKNIYDVIGNEGNYHFIILPPFYKTWWFYGSQIVFLIFLFGLSIWFGSSGKNVRIATVIASLSIIIAFEYFNNYVEENFEGLFGGIMFLKVLLNVILAGFLLPVEGIIKKYILGRNKKTNPYTPPLTEPDKLSSFYKKLKIGKWTLEIKKEGNTE